MVPVGIPSYLSGALTLSRNGGQTWEFLEPNGLRSQTNDNAIHFAPNGRLFVAYISGYTGLQEVGITPLVGAATLFSSMPTLAGYTQWTQTLLPQHSGTENPRSTSAPAPPGQPHPLRASRSPIVANTGILAPVTRICRTLDGGVTWEQRSILFTRPVPRHRSVARTRGDQPRRRQLSPGRPGRLAVGDGPVRGTTYLAKSTDEAATFPSCGGTTAPR